MKVALVHDHYDAAHLEAVKAEMATMGAPVIKAVYMECYDLYAALEGCHRIRAAKELGLVPIIDEVEYSDDAVQFYKVSENIPAAGNSSTTQYYKFLHESEMKPWLYYRVKQVDLDGKVDYSKIVIAKRSSKQPDFKVAIYPIPLMEGDLTLDIHSIAQTEIQIRVIDLLGKEVYREKVPSKGYRTQHQLQLDYCLLRLLED
jgi:hypothetical protein